MVGNNWPRAVRQLGVIAILAILAGVLSALGEDIGTILAALGAAVPVVIAGNLRSPADKSREDGPPPPRDTPPTNPGRARRRTTVLLVLMIPMSIGCAGSALQRHADAALVTRTIGSEAAGVIEDARKAKAMQAIDAAPTQSEAHEALLDLDARFSPAVEAQRAFAAAVDVWADSIALAYAADRGDAYLHRLIPMATEVLSLWTELVAVAERIGIDMPELPAPLRALSAGGE